MFWVATELGGTPWMYRDEPKWSPTDRVFVSDGDSFEAPGFPNPPKPGEKREFSFAEFSAPAPAFKVGDVVRFRTGSQPMIVVGVSTVVDVAMNRGTLERDEFTSTRLPAECLKKECET